MAEVGHLVVAVPIHRGRISPLFEAARRLLVAELADHRECLREEIDLRADRFGAVVEALFGSNAELLVCGAISNASLWKVCRRGIRVWHGLAGCVDEVIASLAATGTLPAAFAMPGAVSPRPSRSEPLAPGPDAFHPGDIDVERGFREPPDERMRDGR